MCRRARLRALFGPRAPADRGDIAGDPTEQRLARHRIRDAVSLCIPAAKFEQGIAVRGRPPTFGNHRLAWCIAEPDETLDGVAIVFVLEHGDNEARVCLERTRAQALQVHERQVTGTEIVRCESDLHRRIYIMP